VSGAPGRADQAFPGWPFSALLERHAALSSTSDRLKELARGGAAEGTIVLARLQTAGRGRQGRAWASPAGNLHLSVLFRPPAAIPLLPLAAGVAVAEAVAGLGPAPRLKWPNDVTVGGRKLAGILAEAATTGARPDHVVLGIGLNVGAALPEELAGVATSLAALGASTLDVEEVASLVLGRVALWYHRLTDGGPSPVLSAWRELSLPWWGGRVRALTAAGPVEGRALDLDEAGGLVLERDDGTRTVLRSGEVQEARAAG
jgi:BirA family biotin operon repressor/biotin-[acetyl-CoA-carboxylase] ligase